MVQETKVNRTIVPRRVLAELRLAGTLAATAANYGVFFICDSPLLDITSAPPTDDIYEVVRVSERHSTAGNDAGAVTAMLKKVASGAAASAGTDMLASGLDMKATADTIQLGTLHGTTANRRIKAGESLAIVITGTPTAVAGAVFMVELKRVG